MSTDRSLHPQAHTRIYISIYVYKYVFGSEDLPALARAQLVKR